MDRPDRRRSPRDRVPTGGLVSLAALLVFGSGLAWAAGGMNAGSAVGWPPSGGLLISEVQTGGTSASDEFVELYNVGSEPVDLSGLEVAYTSSAGTSLSRRVGWTTPVLVPARSHVLLANAGGIYAAGADAAYSSGMAANGGTLVLRPAGGAPIDAVSWGDASNGWVEGAPVAAPSAGASVERRPGGLDGNAQDTNDNAADFLIATPSPQRLSDPPTPAIAPMPSMSPTPEPTVSAAPGPTATGSPAPDPSGPTPEPTPAPSVTPVPTTTPVPTSTPAPTPPLTPTPTPGATPTPTATPAPSASSTPAPTPVPTVTTASIAQARSLPDGATVSIQGTLTTPPGFVESGLEAFLEDSTAGIAIHLTTAWPSLAIGDGLRVHGTLGTRYGQRILRVGSASDLEPVGVPGLAAPPAIATGSAREPWEGRQVTVTGTIGSTRTVLADGFGVDVDDGSGPVRAVAVVASGIASADLPSGARVVATGVLGQHDSGGTGAEGYRLYLRDRSDLVLTAPSPTPSPTATPSPSASPDPSPTPSPSPSASPDPSPTPSPSPSASPSPSPTPEPEPMAIGSARRLAIGTRVTVEGVVTSESGAILDLRTVAVQDATGGLLAVLPSRNAPALARGDLVAITGKLASRYGALQVNVSAPADVRLIGADAVPAARPVNAAALGESVEGLLARASGTVTRVTRATSGSATLVLSDATGAFTVSCWRPCASGLKKGARLQVTGIAGQRASRSGALDGYRIWPRDDRDLVSLAAESGAGAGDAPEAGAEAAPSPPAASVTTIARARTQSGSVTVEAVVTTQPGFIDPDARRVVVQDDSGGILVRLPADAPSASIGDRLRITGRSGTYSGAAQLTASQMVAIAHHAALLPRALSTAPAQGDEWRLVRADGRVQTVHRYGVTWRAEIRLPSGSVVPVQGTSRSGVPSTALAEGHDASVTGIVRGPAAGAADQRLAVLPRAASDVALGPGDAGAGGATAGRAASTGGQSGSGSVGGGSADRAAPGTGTGTGANALDIDLADLGAHLGALVRVGGLVSALRTDGVTLDDGTGTGDVRLEGSAAGLLPMIERGAALNVTGVIQQATGGVSLVVVRDAAAVALVGDLGEAVPLTGVGNRGAASSASDEAEVRPVTELRVGPVAMAVPDGSASAVLGVLALLVLPGAAVALLAWRRLQADRRERTGRGVAARLVTLLAPPPASAGSRSGTDTP